MWFKAQPLGVNTLSKIMSSMYTAAEMSNDVTIGKVSNHSARKTMITDLKKAKVSNTDIIQVTGHKNVNSITSYDAMDYERQKEFSEKLVPTTSSSATASHSDVSTTHDVGDTNINATAHSYVSDVKSSTNPIKPVVFFGGANITGGTFNVNVEYNHCKRRRINVIDSDSD